MRKISTEVRQILTTPRIYSSIALEKGKQCELKQDNYKYLKQVLRLETGDRITVFDGWGHEFEAVIKNFSAGRVALELGKEVEISARDIKITLGQAIPKANKMDVIVRGAAELGADVIIPFTAARSVSRITNEKNPQKTARWQKIACESARCCRSTRIADVFPVVSFEEMLARAGGSALKMIFWEEENQKSIREVLSDQTRAATKDFFIVVGPEGGFSREEIARATAAGFISVSLGKQILKVETAALAIISIIQYEKGIFSKI